MDTNQLQLENEKLNARLEKAKEVFRQQAADIKSKDEAYLKLRDEYNELIKERDTHIDDNAELNKQLTELERENQSISDMYNKTVAGLKIRDNEVEELRKTIAVFEEGNSNYDELQEELNTTKKALHIANETLSEYDSKCKRYDEVIKELNNKLEKRNAEYDLLDVQFTDLENEYNSSEELRKSYTEATNKLNEEVSRLQDIIVSKDAAYKNLESTYNDAAAEHIRDVNALKYTIEQLKKDLEDKDVRLTEAYDKICSLTKQLEDESGKVEDVKTKTEEAVTSIKKKLQALNDGLGDEFNIFG